MAIFRQNAQAHSRESGHFKFSFSVKPFLQLSLSPTVPVVSQQSSCGRWQTLFVS
jgi:hypothetical protein